MTLVKEFFFGIVESNAEVNVVSHVRGHNIVLTSKIIGRGLGVPYLKKFVILFWLMNWLQIQLSIGSKCHGF